MSRPRPHPAATWGGRVRAALTPALLALALGGCGSPSDETVATGRAARLPEHYAHSIAALGWPGARRAFQVGHGSVVGTGEVALAWQLTSASGPVEVSPVWFEADGVPVAHWTMTAPGQRVSFEAAAVPSPALGESSLVCSVRATAECVGATPVEVRLETRLLHQLDGPHDVPWDAPTRWSFDEAWDEHLMRRDGRVVAEVDPAALVAGDAPTTAHPVRVEGSHGGVLVARFAARLAPGQRRAWDFWVPLYPVERGRPGHDAAHEHVTAEARRFWRTTLARATALELPDSLVTLAWRAALVTLVQCQERDSGRWVPIGNPFQYRDVWIRDGARVVRALAAAGLGDYARDDARTLAQYQLPGGALISQRGQIDGTGQAMWAIEQACTLTGDSTLARDLHATAVGALGWIRLQRQATLQIGVRWAGLLPFGDPKDGELVRAQLVGNDAWGIAGCDAIAALARRADDAALAAEAVAEAADYRATFAAALASTHAADLPPSWQGVGRDWGNAAVGWPTAALPAGDARVAALGRRMSARAGDSGLTCYGPDDSLHTYLGADLAEAALRAGRAGEARRWLAGVLSHSSSTLGQAEILSRRDGGFGANLPPHATAAAGVVSLVRDMLVCELGDTLALALGGDAAWWSGAGLSRAPTRFGAATLRLERPDAGTLRVRLEPLGVPLRVRVPDGLRATAASAGRVVDGRWVEAPARTRELTITVTPERGVR